MIWLVEAYTIWEVYDYKPLVGEHRMIGVVEVRMNLGMREHMAWVVKDHKAGVV